MPEHRLSILHISDLHARSMEVDGLPAWVREERQGQVRREAASRARVLGKAWEENLRTLFPNDERPDLVCFTGDVADWGLVSEYGKATEFVDGLVRLLGIGRSQVYVVPGNHDVQRQISKAEWAQLRELLRINPRAASEWLAGGKAPPSIEPGVADAVMRRTAAFWMWVKQGLGRPELLPAKHPHRRLGYHHVPLLSHLPFSVHVVGLDSAWLAGDDHDQGKLWLTEHQRDMLLHDEDGREWVGFRLALVHHPLEELAQPDIGPARRGLARAADLLVHGHQHDAVGSSLVDLDGDVLRVLAAGCLYEGMEGSAWKNGCQRIDVMLNEKGRPLRAKIHFRTWSIRGHWYSDSSLYRGLKDGQMIWTAWGGEPVATLGNEVAPADHDEAPDPIATLLEDAYSRRHELTKLGEDTSDIDSEILSLRRKQRQGPTLRAGAFLDNGRFRLIKVIGTGGFATVWKAHDRTTNCPVAIKVLHGQFAHVTSRRDRLFRGARQMASIKDPHVVRVLVTEGKERGFYYYVMEYVEGGDLRQAIINKKLDSTQALAAIEAIASVLESAHQRGLTHRDVKPQNILLREDGTLALSDFDLVHAMDTTAGTRTGALGTVLYAAPEQNEDASRVDHRADIYSLGMTAIFCIYGKDLPYSAMFDRDTFLGSLPCNESLLAVLRKAVSLQAQDRFESMVSFRAALSNVRNQSHDIITQGAPGQNVAETNPPSLREWANLWVGKDIDERYRLDALVGLGGMGAVFRATHITLGKIFALKILYPDLCRDPTNAGRFMRGVRAAQRVDHENIVNIVDFGKAPDGSLFFAMEFLEGIDLGDALQRDGRMPWSRIQSLMIQLARALKATHDTGIIHRDLKPENCFIVTKPDGQESIKLMDFGISKVIDAEYDEDITPAGVVVGTPAYMSPEQARGEPVDGRTDQYALAAIMYELLTGSVPFGGDNVMRVLTRHIAEPLTLPSTMAPDAGIPPMVESIVVKALSKRREDRYQNMGELEEALLALGADGVLNVRDLPLGLDLPTHGISEPIGLPLEGRGGTLMLDTDGIPPDLIISSYRSDSDTPQGGTVLMDGMGDDLIPIEPKSAAISNNQQDSATSAPTIADPARNNENERSSRSRLAFILLWLAGAAAATLLIQLTLPLGDSSDSLPSESVSSTPSTVVAATTGSKDDDATVGDGDEPDPTGGDSSTTEPDERTVIPSTVNIRSSEELDKGFEKAATEARRCGRSVGAIPGQPITVEAAIKSSGDIASIRIVGPSAFTRLGQCVAKAVKSDAKFIRSKQALQTETFTYKM